MIEIFGDERRTVLHTLLPKEDAPGDQVGWQLADHAVGQAFVDDDGRAAVVVTNRFAVLYGEPRPTIGRVLYDSAFVGTLQGALASTDVRPAVAAVPAEDLADNVRLVLVSDQVRSYAAFPTDSLLLRRVTIDMDDLVRQSIGWWVFEMWPKPSDAPHTICALAEDGQLIAHGGSYAVSPNYVEIAAWIDPIGSGAGLIASGSQYVLHEVLASGRLISSTILVTNDSARRFAAGAGWIVVGETPVVSYAAPAAGSERARLKAQ